MCRCEMERAGGAIASGVECSGATLKRNPMTEVTRLSGLRATAEDVIAALERDGGVIIEDFLTNETLDGLRNDLLPLIERQPVGRDNFSGNRTRRLSRLFARTRHCVESATHPLDLPVAEHFLCRPREVWVGDRRVTLTAGVRIGVRGSHSSTSRSPFRSAPTCSRSRRVR